VHSPVGLVFDTGDSLNGIKNVLVFSQLLDICVDEERVHFRMDVLHHDLEAIEASSLCGLDLVRESFNEVLIDNSIGCGEESEDMRGARYRSACSSSHGCPWTGPFPPPSRRMLQPSCTFVRSEGCISGDT
jgi:hypothetical protein